MYSTQQTYMKTVVTTLALLLFFNMPAMARYVPVEDNSVNHWSSNIINGNEFTDAQYKELHELLSIRKFYVAIGNTEAVELIDNYISEKVKNWRLW